MIKSFKGKLSESVWNGTVTKGFAIDLTRIATRKLSMINAAVNINDLRVPPGNRLEKLSGDLEGQYSIRINDQWRIVFRWSEDTAHDVEIIDYH